MGISDEEIVLEETDVQAVGDDSDDGGADDSGDDSGDDSDDGGADDSGDDSGDDSDDGGADDS